MFGFVTALHLLMWLLDFGGASGILVLLWPIRDPLGSGNVCSGITNPVHCTSWTEYQHWDGPALLYPRVGQSTNPGALLECLESVRTSLLALTQMETQISNTTHAVLIVLLVWLHSGMGHYAV